MSLALYRRYRPETFAEVIGQDHVTGPLQQALRNDRVHHAYLFSGPRGCGKTTSARILARALNCERGPTPEPCGVCDSCVALARGGPGSLDVIEIDAASHGGVDDARDLRERAFFAPATSRFKIYIVDEAHMVTTQGFNALLKLVEEPPEHVKFIFATTEPEKVIGTIRSRTHHYPFRLVPPGTLSAYLADLCVREGIDVDPAVLPLVVLAGAGSVRDSLSVLDQLLAGAGAGGVTYAEATALLGYTDASLLEGVIDAFAAGDGAAVFQLVDRVVEAGHDPRRFVADLLDRLRDLILVDAVPDAIDKGLVVGPPELLTALPGQAARFGQAELVRAADLVNAGLTELRGATAPRLRLELICARVLLPAVTADEVGLAARVDRLERRFAIAAPADGPAAAASDAATPTSADVAAAGRGDAAAASRRPKPDAVDGAAPAPTTTRVHAGADGARVETRTTVRADTTATASEPTAEPQTPGRGKLDAVEIRRLWPTVLDTVKSRRRVTWMLLFEKVTVSGVDADGIVLAFPDTGSLTNFTKGQHDAVLSAALRDALGIDLGIQAVLDPSKSGETGRSSSTGRASGTGDAIRETESAGQRTQADQPSPARAMLTPTSPRDATAESAGPGLVATAGTGTDGRASARATAEAYRRAGPRRAAEAGASSTPSPGASSAPQDQFGGYPDEPDPANDPDADDHLSAADLVARELGATVVERAD